ncbi:hypothetical protein PFISCL1PPCAC_3808 [Pristionchus fissidentatus]|uniref:BTB domain-containing protein n=1 Tax=Pristionchus fissidentatus TaxID=1538716 RepID=A0AAV5UZ18_9BILA|nr:hypothetical protein PFISCL1PPCAC_3808 [Pristionchus fissidentatus]
MSAEDEVAKLREQIRLMAEERRLMESKHAEQQATIEVLKEKMHAADEPNVSEYTFALDFEVPAEGDERKRDPVKSEAVELEGIRTEIFAQKVIDSNGAEQIQLWAELVSDQCYNLTVFTELQLATLTPGSSEYNKPKIFELRSELVRATSGRLIQCAKTTVPEWAQKYAAQLRGQTVQIRMRIKIVRTFQPNLTVICESDSEMSEVDVGGKKMLVHVGYLSAWSHELRENLQGKRKEIKDLSSTDFEEMLAVIYPSGKPITAWNIDLLLELAHKLKMPELTRRCEIFLNDRTAHILSECQTLLLADTYRLYAIKTIVLERIATTDELRAKILRQDDYHRLNPEMRKAINSRYVELDLLEKNIEGVVNV